MHDLPCVSFLSAENGKIRQLYFNIQGMPDTSGKRCEFEFITIFTVCGVTVEMYSCVMPLLYS